MIINEFFVVVCYKLIFHVPQFIVVVILVKVQIVQTYALSPLLIEDPQHWI